MVRLAAAAGRAVLADTAQLGVYRVRWGGEEQGSFAVNLFSPQESDVKPAAALPLAGAGVAGDEEPRQQARREWWRGLALAALALLSAEWLAYQRPSLRRR